MYKLLFVNGQKTQKKNSDFFIEMREKSKNSPSEDFLRQAVLNLVI